MPEFHPIKAARSFINAPWGEKRTATLQALRGRRPTDLATSGKLTQGEFLARLLETNSENSSLPTIPFYELGRPEPSQRAHITSELVELGMLDLLKATHPEIESDNWIVTEMYFYRGLHGYRWYEQFEQVKRTGEFIEGKNLLDEKLVGRSHEMLVVRYRLPGQEEQVREFYYIKGSGEIADGYNDKPYDKKLDAEARAKAHRLLQSSLVVRTRRNLTNFGPVIISVSQSLPPGPMEGDRSEI